MSTPKVWTIDDYEVGGRREITLRDERYEVTLEIDRDGDLVIEHEVDSDSYGGGSRTVRCRVPMAEVERWLAMVRPSSSTAPSADPSDDPPPVGVPFWVAEERANRAGGPWYLPRRSRGTGCPVNEIHEALWFTTGAECDAWTAYKFPEFTPREHLIMLPAAPAPRQPSEPDTLSGRICRSCGRGPQRVSVPEGICETCAATARQPSDTDTARCDWPGCTAPATGFAIGVGGYQRCMSHDPCCGASSAPSSTTPTPETP